MSCPHTDNNEVYFRGDLKVTVKKANDLPNADGQLSITSMFDSFMSCSDKPKDVSDPYVNICIDDNKILQTKVIKDNLNPVWNETFQTEVSHEGTYLYFWVWDDDILGKDKLGHATLKLCEIIEKKVIKRTLELYTPFPKCSPTIDVEVEFEPVSDTVGQFEVTQSYFPLRHSGEARLYQDACTRPSPLHSMFTVHGQPYQPYSAWDDVSDTIVGAKHFIFITGWSMTHTVRLKRDPKCGAATRGYPILGALLKEKANSGVQVLVLLWDEPFNNDDLAMSGVVGTNDEVTKTFFQGSKVSCVLATRRKSKRGMLETFISNTSFSHHQKTVIADDEKAARGIVAYLGGLDLTVGRYDDQDHALFTSCDTTHIDDFYQTFPGILSTLQGPRQPWHDVHARITGEAAEDVLTNFIERWKIEAPKEIIELPNVAENICNDASTADTDTKWRIQIFRSIPKDAALFDENKKSLLQSKHGRRYEASIHRAYVSAIRNSENFLYIENQYFLGSAHRWFSKGSPRANHLVPVEIAEQICEKIKRNERFVAYILVPLFPEGDPCAPHIQEMLHWQATTMKMMYKKIAKTIKKMDIKEGPCDYLNFFCLGKREETPASLAQITDETAAKKLTKHGRGMIYVHSKAMVVDDIYAIVGSANINQRSMDGRRDTEIAMGCWENDDSKLISEGHVNGLRKGLWTEHLGCYEDIFDRPGSLECVRRVVELAQQNWESYISEKLPSRSMGHMMRYPIHVEADGDLTASHDLVNGCFPDTTAPVLGSKSNFLPSRLTV